MKKKNWIPLLVIMVVVAYLVSCVFNKEQAPDTHPLEPIIREASGAVVSIDPRMELLSAQYILSGFQAVSMLDCSYKDAMTSYFAEMGKHRSVQTFRQMHQRGIFWNAPPALMMHLSSVPELEIRVPIPDVTIRQLNTTQRRINTWRSQLNQFASTSHFVDFFDQHMDFYHNTVEQVSSLVEKYPYVDDLEAYFGQQQEAYHIVLMPLIMGNYGVWVEGASGKEVYAMVSEYRDQHGLNESFLRNMIWHEFAHSFVDPLGYAHEQELSQSEHLYDQIRNKVRPSGYTTWTITVNEHIVRAVVIRLKQARFGDQMAEQRLHKDKEQGFDYIDILLDRLIYYEDNRHLYRTFADFYPQLIAVLNEL